MKAYIYNAPRFSGNWLIGKRTKTPGWAVGFCSDPVAWFEDINKAREFAAKYTPSQGCDASVFSK